MAHPVIAYIPYAAATYCVAKVAQHVWPTLRSQLASSTHYSSMHGMDGEDPIETRRAMDCPQGPHAYMAAASQRNPYVRNATYCYDLDSGALVGDGPLGGTVPPLVAVSLWTDDDGTQLASVNVSGDATITVPVCGGPDRIPPPSRQPPRYVPPRGDGERPPRDPGDCGRRPVPTLPFFRRANCGPAERREHNERMAMRARRWG